MMKTSLKLLLLLTIFIFGCTPAKNDTTASTKTGVEMIAIGSIQFGNVTIGSYREATIKITNYGPNTVDSFSPILNTPFSITKIAPPCDAGSIGVNVSCNVIIRFTPTSKGTFADTFIASDKSQPITGRGLDSAGVIDYSVFSWDLGTVISGDSTLKDVDLTNNGDFTVSTPTFAPLTGYTRTQNDCGTFIAPKRTCKMKFTIVKQGIGSYTESLVFSSPDTANFTMTVTSVVVPGPPSGTISILNPPSAIIADNADTRTITLAPIRDQFNNVVSDGNNISIIVNNLILVGPSTLPTVGGVISFNVQSTNQRGDATITIISGAASGFARFKSIAGPAVGSITVKTSYIDTVEANGLNQIDVRLAPLRDKFNNVVEDGTPVNFCIKTQPGDCFGTTPGSGGGGTLISASTNTVLGESIATVVPPLVVGDATLIVQAGTNNGALPCGWSACGSFPLHYVPGQSSGIISVVSSMNGIFADPSLGLSSTPPEVIQSTITIGPVKDKNNNIVASGTQIAISLDNAIGVISSTSSFDVSTNASGIATFAIQGIGVRGYINISAVKDLASGFNKIWAYGAATLRPMGSSYPNNPFKIFMTYNSINTNPLPTAGWGLIKNWSNIDIQDKNYFGDLKKQAAPTLIASNIPYFVSKCLFSSGNTTYGSSCFENNFNDSSLSASTYKIVKANATSDPGASRVDPILNAFPRSVKHKDNAPGCYKQDNTPGSATYGYLIFYDTTQSRCNDQTSTDPSSPVYQNNLYPWFGGSWLTNYAFDLQFSSVGFLPDVGRSLIFGGFFQKPVYGSSQNTFDVIMSNRHTWAGNFGIDQPYSWTADQNTTGIFGDFPSPVVFPTLSSSNKDMYMFGGLKLVGTSNTSAGPTTNYIQSSASADFAVFDGILNKWFSLSPGQDSSLPESILVKSPAGRYQHGMVFVPDNNKLFVAGGKTVNPTQSLVWNEPNDMWSVDMTDRSASLEWKRNCSPCGFPANAHNHPVNLTPGTINPTPLKMAYNPYLQKVFMLWSGTNYNISSFNPLIGDVVSISNSNTYSFSSLQGPGLFDMEVNSDIGRTYFYNRKTINSADSELYYWDMDAGNKQYLRFETDLGGAPAKAFIRKLEIHVRGYGSMKDTSQVVQGVGGIVVRVYNYDTASWDLVSSNTAKIDSEDVSAQAVSNSYGEGIAPKYVSADGKVNTLITINDLSNYAGEGYNELKIDEFYINGLF
jgi:hypothetical protein